MGVLFHLSPIPAVPGGTEFPAGRITIELHLQPNPGRTPVCMWHLTGCWLPCGRECFRLIVHAGSLDFPIPARAGDVCWVTVSFPRAGKLRFCAHHMHGQVLQLLQPRHLAWCLHLLEESEINPRSFLRTGSSSVLPLGN